MGFWKRRECPCEAAQRQLFLGRRQISGVVVRQQGLPSHTQNRRQRINSASQDETIREKKRSGKPVPAPGVGSADSRGVGGAPRAGLRFRHLQGRIKEHAN